MLYSSPRLILSVHSLSPCGCRKFSKGSFIDLYLISLQYLNSASVLQSVADLSTPPKLPKFVSACKCVCTYQDVCVCVRKCIKMRKRCLSFIRVTAFHTGLVLTMLNLSPRAPIAVPPLSVWYNQYCFGPNRPYLVKFSTDQLLHGDNLLLIQIHLTLGRRKSISPSYDRHRKVETQQFLFITTGFREDSLGHFHINKCVLLLSSVHWRNWGSARWGSAVSSPDL